MNSQPESNSFLKQYLLPLAPVLRDPSVVEVAINPDGRIWVERIGATHMTVLETVYAVARASDLGRAIASETRSRLGSETPMVSGKIEVDGQPVRAQVIVAPVIEGGAAVTLRRYVETKLQLESIGLLFGELVDLQKKRSDMAAEVVKLTARGEVVAAMALCVRERLNIMVSGGTSTGKTTFARALLDLVYPEERIVTIEDAFELFPSQPNRVMLKADRKEGSPRSASKLLEATLRLRPDRIILGELRGEECKTFLDAINTGHSGSFTTIHADTAKKAIDRLALMVMSVGLNMRFEEVRHYCASSIDVIVQLGRADGRRGIAEVYLPGMD